MMGAPRTTKRGLGRKNDLPRRAAGSVDRTRFGRAPTPDERRPVRLQSSWSSDGKHVYFSSERGGIQESVAYRHQGEASPRDARRAPETSTTATSAGWIADSPPRRSRGPALHIRGYEVRNGQEGARCAATVCPAIAPDGSKVVFTSDRAGRTLSISGCKPLGREMPSGRPQRRTQDTAHASCPAFSRDGKWIAYYRILGERRDIYKIRASGGRPIMCFTDDPAPDFQPSGRRMVRSWSSYPNRRIPRVAAGIRGKPPVRQSDHERHGPRARRSGPRRRADSLRRRTETWIVPADGTAPEERSRRERRRRRSVRISPTALTARQRQLGEDSVSLRRISPDGGAVEPVVLMLFIGRRMPSTFDVSMDGRYVVLHRENTGETSGCTKRRREQYNIIRR